MSKKLMNFGDGLKEIKVGDEVVSDNGQSGGHFNLNKYKVASVGNKLATMTDGTKFFLETGKKQSNYIWGRLYSSKEAYDKEVSDQAIIKSVRKYFHQINPKLTVDQALEIKKILGI